VPFAIASDI
ncbi:hypothetical protein D049_3378, partial [Vibrio parahaemolyticus VPTS-2010]